MGDPGCIFCKIVAGEAPAYRIYEDDSVVSFMDIFPWARGHSLVVPKRHATTIFDIAERDVTAVIQAARRIAPVLAEQVGAEGMNLLQSNGRAAWQTVDHFHLHLIPRWAGDSLVAPGTSAPGDRGVIEATAAEIAAKLRS